MPAKTTIECCHRDIARAPVCRAKDEAKPVIEGYGAVFYDPEDAKGTQYHLWGNVYERIAPAAFAKAIQGQDDVRSLFNHDSNIVLGRVSAGTLKLSIDNRGLWYEASPPDTQTIRDQVMSPIERGDVSGSSIMFIPRRGGVVWREEEKDGIELEIRELIDVELWEVGPVTFPAFSSTTSGVRGAGNMIDFIMDEHDQWKRSRRKAIETVRMQYSRIPRILRMD